MKMVMLSYCHKTGEFYDKNQTRLGFLWQVFMLQFRDDFSLAKAQNLLIKFSEDLNAKVLK